MRIYLHIHHEHMDKVLRNKIKNCLRNITAHLLFLRHHSAQSHLEVLAVQLGRELLDYQ